MNVLNHLFYNKLQENPIIAAIRDHTQINAALQSPSEIIFILKSDIFNISSIVDQVHANRKQIYIHMDLIEGLAKDTLAIKYIQQKIRPDGIITTRANLVKTAKDLNMLVIQRCFVLDHLSLDTGIESINSIKPDAVEILPGIMPRIIKKFAESTNIPIIAGGLIMNKKDILQNLQAGAVGISTSKEEIWYM
ncbi:glycerol-3-phosphate responsive antiterminator [Garciella nitratireducens]|uniref:glycerol-3-phosphate responsive antiterminator n=1 Tax=Garciella nitratireducens TaxID=218205 RepID=UPI001FA89A50|nr:glycerol-3-phosphate responsive antiterminator [Garciella nitratireducens]